jgi:hypothetical protein
METERSSASAPYRLQENSHSVSREELYNFLNEFGIVMKLVRLIKCVGLKK